MSSIPPDSSSRDALPLSVFSVVCRAYRLIRHICHVREYPSREVCVAACHRDAAGRRVARVHIRRVLRLAVVILRHREQSEVGVHVPELQDAVDYLYPEKRPVLGEHPYRRVAPSARVLELRKLIDEYRRRAVVQKTDYLSHDSHIPLASPHEVRLASLSSSIISESVRRKAAASRRRYRSDRTSRPRSAQCRRLRRSVTPLQYSENLSIVHFPGAYRVVDIRDVPLRREVLVEIHDADVVQGREIHIPPIMK